MRAARYLFGLLAVVAGSAVGLASSAHAATGTWVRVSAGGGHVCAISASENLYCWGGNRSGELGTGTAWRATLEQIQN